jgi:TetR/AcrR family transcriptional repressor of nem operon
MRIAKEKVAENRGKVVAAAAGLLRARGLDGVGVDALAEAAGLTHGAVYSHFKSKSELAAEAVRQAMHLSMDEWLALTKGLSADAAFAQLLKTYVSRAHRDHPEVGCTVAAIGSGAPRAADDLREVFSTGTAQFIDILSSVTEAETDADRRRMAIARAAAMVGAVVMARAAASDKVLSDEILKSVRTELLSHPAAVANHRSDETR